MSELFEAVEKPRRIAAGVEQHLKELIQARRLVVGDRLPPERQLAERLGVNRSTLRNALQSLADQGVLSGRQGSGWTVQPQGHIVSANLTVYLQLEDVTFEQLFDARRVVEPQIASRAAEHRTEEQLVAMRACIAAMHATTDPETYLQADSDFHALIAAASDNPVFSVIIGPALNLLGDVRRRLVSVAEVIQASHAEHQVILRAIERGNSRLAHNAMLAHIDRFVRSGRQILEQTSDGVSGRT